MAESKNNVVTQGLSGMAGDAVLNNNEPGCIYTATQNNEALTGGKMTVTAIGMPDNTTEKVTMP